MLFYMKVLSTKQRALQSAEKILLRARSHYLMNQSRNPKFLRRECYFSFTSAVCDNRRVSVMDAFYDHIKPRPVVHFGPPL